MKGRRCGRIWACRGRKTASSRVKRRRIGRESPQATLTLGASWLGCRQTAPPLWPVPTLIPFREVQYMAKAVTIKVMLVALADNGFYCVAKKNSRTLAEIMVK